MRQFVHLDPTTGMRVGAWDLDTDGAVRLKIDQAQAAWEGWRQTPYAARSEALRALAARFRDRADHLAGLMADEMGKPLAEGRAEIEKCAWTAEWFAEHGEALLADEPIVSDGSKSWVQADPLGLVLAIMPWNFPFWQVLRFGAPALMARNGIVLKHAPNVPGCGAALQDLALEAGLPEGLLTNLRIDEDQVAALLADPRVAAVTLTGSTGAGRAVAAEAGRHLKPSVLELGGSDPFIVLADAELGRAAEVGARSRLVNSGQSCIAAKRFIVVREVAERFLQLFAEQLQAAVVGPPRDPSTTVGPMAREDLRDQLHRQVQQSVAAGATLHFGGALPEGPGFFYPVTLLSGVGPGMAAWDEELFGPVAAVRVVADEDEALKAANETAFGLGASLWTRDTDRARELARRVEAGAVFFNGLVKSDPRLPFGGIKDSGYGRELARQGLHAFVNTKSVWVA